jgi:hypothetical protein
MIFAAFHVARWSLPNLKENCERVCECQARLIQSLAERLMYDLFQSTAEQGFYQLKTVFKN